MYRSTARSGGRRREERKSIWKPVWRVFGWSLECFLLFFLLDFFSSFFAFSFRTYVSSSVRRLFTDFFIQLSRAAGVSSRFAWSSNLSLSFDTFCVFGSFHWTLSQQKEKRWKNCKKSKLKWVLVERWELNISTSEEHKWKCRAQWNDREKEKWITKNVSAILE